MRVVFQPARAVLAVVLAFGTYACREAEPEASLARPVRPASARGLVRADSCDALVARLREDARFRADLAAYQMLQSYDTLAAPYGGGALDAGLATTGPAVGTASGGGVSQTNVQVDGVDELDRVDTTGDRTYLLDGDELVVLATSPIAASRRVGSITLAGSPIGLSVEGDRALVVSQVYDSGGYYPLEPFDASVAALPLGSAPGVHVVTLDLSTDTPTVLSYRVLAGSFLGARRHGDVARVVVARPLPSFAYGYGPSYPSWYRLDGTRVPRDEFFRAVVAWRDQSYAQADSLSRDDILPPDWELVNGIFAERPTRCEDVYTVGVGAAGQGFTSIASVSLADATASATTTVAASGFILYASADALVLAYAELVDSPATGTTVASELRTTLHRFALDGLPTRYEASGSVAGTLASSYAFDADATRTRVVVTTSQGTFVRVLATQGDALVETGASGPLAAGESVYAVRFLAARAYVVTFRRIHPLFVVDVSTDAPRLLGEVELPGFSTYVHPLGPSHLLTIGYAGTPSNSVALRIFDVSDPAAPVLSHEVAIGDSSSATYDPHDFVFDAARGLLAVPVSGWVYAPAYELHSRLALYRISIADGIASAGEVTHGDALPCDPSDPYAGICAPAPQLWRGVFLTDGLLAIGSDAVTAHDLADLPTPLARIPLSGVSSPPTSYFGF